MSYNGLPFIAGFDGPSFVLPSRTYNVQTNLCKLNKETWITILDGSAMHYVVARKSATVTKSVVEQ